MKKAVALFLTLLLCLPSIALAEGSAQVGVKFQANKLTLTQEDVYPLTHSLENADSETRLLWTSSNPEIAQVDEQGVITALKSGSAKITVSTGDGAAKATCKVTVKKIKKTPVKATIEGNVYDGDYNRASSSAEEAVRKYCERLGSSRGEKIVRAAVEKLGTSYSVMDCSQLVQYAYKVNKIKLSRTSGSQARDMARYERADGRLRAGDVIFLSFPAGRECSCGTPCRRYRQVHHSALYLGNVEGTDYVVDSSSYFGNVIIRAFSGSTIAGMNAVFVAGR